MRNGTILSFNKKVSIGLIKDANDQHILFHYLGTDHIPIRGSDVSFEIELHKGMLIAVNINVLKHKSLHIRSRQLAKPNIASITSSNEDAG